MQILPFGDKPNWLAAQNLYNSDNIDIGAVSTSKFLSGKTPLDQQIRNFLKWSDKTAEQVLTSKRNDSYYLGPLEKPVNLEQLLSPREKQEWTRTLDLYKRNFSTFLWTGYECSNPENKNGERWDELELSGIYQPEIRAKQLDMMRTLKLENMRFGIPNHKVDEQKSWAVPDSIFQDLRQRNIKISLDLLHFGLPSRFRVSGKPEESLFLNPKWVDYFIDYATSAFKRYHNDVKAITIINEPMITNAFSGIHWNEGFPGLGKKEYDRYFIQRAIYIAQASTGTRLAIEQHIQAQPDPEKARRIFIHNESVDYRTDDENANRYRRFLTSDLMLGQDWLLRPDYQKSDMFAWITREFVRTDNAKKDLEALVAGLESIRENHLMFQKQFGKTMKADTVFGVDYYTYNEGGSTPGKQLSYESQNYPRDLSAGRRKGLYGITMEYFRRYRLPIFHAETNNFGNKDDDHWGTQQLLELAQVLKTGVPILGFTWYSLMDQFGWEHVLGGSPKDAQRNPIGLVNTQDYNLRDFAKKVLPNLTRAFFQK